jgi:hypothetical protein
MIRNEKEMQEAAWRLAEEAQRIQEHRLRLKVAGFSDDEIQRAIDPLESFHLQKREEFESQYLPNDDLKKLILCEAIRGRGHWQ